MNNAFKAPCTPDSTKSLVKLLIVLCNHNNQQVRQTNTIYSKIINEAFVSQQMWNHLCDFLDLHLPPTDDLHRKSPISLYSVWRECQRTHKHKQALCALWHILKRKDDLPKKFYNKLHQEVEQYLVSFFPMNKITETIYGTDITQSTAFYC